MSGSRLSACSSSSCRFPIPTSARSRRLKTRKGSFGRCGRLMLRRSALSLTIIVFAVQAYRSSTQERYGGTLRRFIRASLLQEGYELGVIALLLIAVVLLGVGHGGPAGSAGVVVAGVSLLSIAVLPPLLSRALGTTNRDFLREERTSRLASAVQEQVDHEKQARIGMGILTRLAAVEPIDMALLGDQRGSPAEAVLAGQVGTVADINLRRLIRLGRRLAGAGGIRLSTRLADYVGSESRVLVLPAGVSQRDRRLARRTITVRSGRRRDETLSRYLDDLNEEAAGAIRTGGPTTFELVADAYVEALMEFPRSWQRYGQQYDEAVARGIEFFPTGPVDEIRQQFYTHLVEALRAGNQEVLLTAAYLPARVASRALAYRADGLFGKMLSLSPAFLAAAWAHGGGSSQLLEERSYRHLVELTRFYLEPRLDEGEIADRLRVVAHIRLVYTQIQAMLKMGVDAGRVEFLRRLDGHWGALPQTWQVELLDPSAHEIPYLEEAVSNGEAGATELLAQARENSQLAASMEALADYRMVARFGLALWAWRQQQPSWRESFTHFSTQIGDLRTITDVTTKAIDADDRDRMPWSDWILNELQEGEVHVIGTSEAVIEAFVAMMLRALKTDKPTPQLPPSAWMPQYLDHARQLLRNAVDDPRNSDLPDVALRAERVREALEGGAKAWNEKERLSTIEAPLVQEKVDEFREQASAALQKNRVVPDLLRIADALTMLDAKPEKPPLFESRAHKALFIEGGRMIGADMVALHVGRSVAHVELRQLIEPMANVPSTLIVAEDASSSSDPAQEFTKELHRLISRIAGDTEPEYAVLFMPIQWRLSQALGLSFLGTGVSVPEAWALSEGSAHDFAGFFAGIPAFQFPEVPDEVLYLVDLTRYMSAESWPLTDAASLSMRILGEDEALERARRTEGHEQIGDEEISMRWREQVFITVDPGIRLNDDRDDSAITAVQLPAAFGAV